MSEILDTHFPEPDAEWAGVKPFLRGNKVFGEFERLVTMHGINEHTAAKWALLPNNKRPEEAVEKLRGFSSIDL